MTGTMTSKGQITVPAEIRKTFRLQAGSRVEFVVREERVELIPLSMSVKSLKGILPKPRRPLSVADMQKAIAEGAAR